MSITKCGMCGMPIGGRDLNAHYATDCKMPLTENLHTRIRDLEQRLDEAVAAEREACAMVAESWADHYPVDVFPEDGTSIDCISAGAMRHAAQQIAAAIRAREGDR
jgi:hypothetical protein